MIVLLINTVIYGSTGQICKDIAHALEKNGEEGYIAFGQGSSDFKKSYKIGTKIENHLHNAFSRMFGNQGYYSYIGTKKLIKYIQQIKPNVIHLHNLHGNYLNLKLLFQFLSNANIPVVWTLHDCWAFTGKCAHYSEIGCYKWQTHCSHCPQLKKYPPSMFFDRSEVMFEDKKKWFTSIKNLTLIPVSNWLANETRRSFLSQYPIVPIYNWIDQAIYKPTVSNIRKKLRLAENHFVILGVSAGWPKQSTKLADFIKLADKISNDMQIILVGGKKQIESLPHNIQHLPYVNNQTEMAEIYSMADVYVHMSVEDTFGKVIAEALSCGTPAIVYNSTACPELIGEGCGFVVPIRDIEGVFNTIRTIKANSKLEYTTQCKSYSNDHFNIEKIIASTIQLYNKVLLQ